MNEPDNQSKSLKSAFFVLILLILAMVGAGYLSRNALFAILVRYSKDFGTFIIYTGFVGVSLIAAVVMFGIMRSTGIFKKTGKKGYQYEFGGAMAGFMATLVFLITSYSAQVPAPMFLQITGNVRFVKDGKPVGPAADANVALSGHSGFQTETDRNGNFSLSIPGNQQIQDIELIITHKGKTSYHPVKRSEMENLIIQIESTPEFILENPVLRSYAEMIIKPGNKAAKRFEPLDIEFDDILFSKKGIPVEKQGVKKKSFFNGFST